MDQLIVIAANTLLIPFITALAKKIFKTDAMDEKTKKTVHTLMPLVAGVLSNGIYEYQRSHDWKVAFAVGLGSGGAASSLRDADKNMNLIGSVREMLQKDDSEPKQ